MNVMRDDHWPYYRDIAEIGSCLSKLPKITMASYCIIKVYLFEFNELIQQFWICSL